jgi:hypothetical protein
MSERRVELSPSCSLVYTYWEHTGQSGVTLEHPEHSQDHWCGNLETIVDIDRETAQQIIDLLRQAHDL